MAVSRDRKVATGESTGLSVLLSWEGLYQVSSLSSGVLEIEGKELLIPMVTVGQKDRDSRPVGLRDHVCSSTTAVSCVKSTQDTTIFLPFELSL